MIVKKGLEITKGSTHFKDKEMRSSGRKGLAQAPRGIPGRARGGTRRTPVGALEFVGDAKLNLLKAIAAIDCTKSFWRPSDYRKIH